MTSDEAANARPSWIFGLGDCAASVLVGVATALVVRLLVTPRWDMVLAMVVGMVVGTIIHLVVGLLVTPLLVALEAMVPAGLTGMYGGMYFAMRDVMHPVPVPIQHAAIVGALAGVISFGAVSIYDRMIRGVVFYTRAAGRHE